MLQGEQVLERTVRAEPGGRGGETRDGSHIEEFG